MRRRARRLTLLSLLNEQGTVQRSLSVFVLGLDTALVLLVLVSGQVQVEALVLCLRALPQVLVLVRQLPAAEVVLHHHHRPTTADYFQAIVSVLVALSHHGCREVVCL